MRWFMRFIDPAWYRYLAAKYPDRVAVAAVVVVGLLAFAGYSTVGAMGGSGNALGADTFVQMTTTVIRDVRVKQHGQVTVKHVAVVKRIFARPSTVLLTHTVQTPAGTQVVTRPVVEYRPVYRTHVVTVHGKEVTIARVVTNTKMLTNTKLVTATQLATVTNEHTNTVVQNQTQTVNQTATVTLTTRSPPETVTVTVTGPGSTVTVVQTQREVTTVTVTQPAPPPPPPKTTS